MRELAFFPSIFIEEGEDLQEAIWSAIKTSQTNILYRNLSLGDYKDIPYRRDAAYLRHAYTLTVGLREARFSVLPLLNGDTTVAMMGENGESIHASEINCPTIVSLAPRSSRRYAGITYDFPDGGRLLHSLFITENLRESSANSMVRE